MASKLDDLLNDLEKKSGLTKKELEEKINQKYKELSGVVSLEGSAYIVAKELGIILEEKKKRLNMKDIVSGMKGVNAIGRIFRISNIVEFDRSDGSKGKVVNLYISDGNSFVKLALWDNQVKLVEDEDIKLGDTIEISNAYAKENPFGDIELTLGRFGNIKPVDANIPDIDQLQKKFMSTIPQRVMIKELIPGVFEIRASIVHLFRGNFIFDTCSICNSSLQDGKCLEHGEIESNPALVVSTIVDDGTESIRTVFFRDVAEKLCGIKAEDTTSMNIDERYEFIKNKVLGKEIILTGRVKKNQMFNRIEMIANSFKEIDTREESNKLIDEILLKIGSDVE